MQGGEQGGEGRRKKECATAYVAPSSGLCVPKSGIPLSCARSGLTCVFTGSGVPFLDVNLSRPGCPRVSNNVSNMATRCEARRPSHTNT